MEPADNAPRLFSHERFLEQQTKKLAQTRGLPPVLRQRSSVRVEPNVQIAHGVCGVMQRICCEQVAPADDDNRRMTRPELLEPHGWTRVFERDNVTHWRRPGKDRRLGHDEPRRQRSALHVLELDVV